MKITIAKTAGFCMGVSRAVEMALDASNRNKDKICTYGPLIHNPQVLNILKEKGVPAIDHIPEKGSGTVLIRAHGVPPETKKKLKDVGFKVIDATCPRVIRVQTIIRKHTQQGYASIIIGDKEHPEVIGLYGYSNGKGYVVNTMEELNNLPAFNKAIIVAQTTQNTNFYKQVYQWAKQKFPHYKFFNTICDSTEKRQAEIAELAKSADSIVVVGGKNSGNTQRLAEIAAQSGKPTFHIEQESELDLKVLESGKSIAITAGASTPSWIINRVYRHLESSFSQKKNKFEQKLFNIQKVILNTNIYLAIGAGSLCYTCNKLQGIDNDIRSIFIAIFYILSMQIFNRLTAIKSDFYNDPVRAVFYNQKKILLTSLAFIIGALGLTISYFIGLVSFLFLLIMSLLGLSYNLKIIPTTIFKGKYQSLKDIPGSKTVLISFAWGLVTTILPAIANKISGVTFIVFICASIIVLTRTAFFEIIDMQGDRIVGKETIPILLGTDSTMTLLNYMLLCIFILLLGLSGFGHSRNLATVIGIFYPCIFGAILFAYKKGYVIAGTKLEFMVESNFILVGLITFLWSII